MGKRSNKGLFMEKCETYDQMSDKGSDFLIKKIKEKPKSLICIATGSSPLSMYRKFISRCKMESIPTDQLRFIKLDEWYGLEPDNEATCEYYFRKEIAEPLNVSPDRIISFNGIASNPKKECERVEGLLEMWGPIDVCILGLGRNGHLGLNEPGSALTANPHFIELTEKSRGHALLAKADKPVTMGLTLGMAAILQAKEILFLVSGSAKKEEFNNFLTREVKTGLPASFLWLHPAVSCFVDESSVGSSATESVVSDSEKRS